MIDSPSEGFGKTWCPVGQMEDGSLALSGDWFLVVPCHSPLARNKPCLEVVGVISVGW